jgi:hypothetical protein
MKRGKFTTASQREHCRQAFRLISFCAGSIYTGDYKQAYEEAIEAQKHMTIVFGIIDENEMFPKEPER